MDCLLTTEGKPTSAILASPLLLTSNPVPPPDDAPGPGSRSCARNRASFLEPYSAKCDIDSNGHIASTLSVGQGDILNRVNHTVNCMNQSKSMLYQ